MPFIKTPGSKRLAQLLLKDHFLERYSDDRWLKDPPYSLWEQACGNPLLSESVCSEDNDEILY